MPGFLGSILMIWHEFFSEKVHGSKEKTYHYYDSKRGQLFHFMKQKIAEGRQVYVVYPLINESEKLDLKDLMDGYESISRSFPLPDCAITKRYVENTVEFNQDDIDRVTVL